MNEWISVNDKLPEIDQWVLCFSTNRDPNENYKEEPGYELLPYVVQYCTNLRGDFYWMILRSGCGCCDSDVLDVTHWMPLPHAPK